MNHDCSGDQNWIDLLSTKHIPRYYYSKESCITTAELHGFCDASDKAYAAAVYLRMTDSNGSVQVALVIPKPGWP